MLEKLLWFPLEDFPFIIIVLIIAFSVHEFAHAYFAYKFGDDTAYKEGRVTLNPRVHLDVVGTILLIIAGFGWAKPVPVRASRFKNPRVMSMIVSAAGPLSNLLIAFAGLVLFYFMNETGLLHAGSQGVYSALVHFFYYLILINLTLFVFNLIPLPPLDGYRIVSELLPLKIRYKIDQNIQWGMLIFLLIVFIPQLRAVTLTPIMGSISDIFNALIRLVEMVFSPMDWARITIDFFN